jgi:hypothetical protein
MQWSCQEGIEVVAKVLEIERGEQFREKELELDEAVTHLQYPFH